MAVWTAKKEARYAHTVESWDTPFTPLEGDVASYGLRVDVREPHVTYPWANASSFLSALQAAPATGAGDVNTVFLDATKSTALVTDGRAPNLQEYWSAGSPLWYGASQRGRVALHYKCVLRPVAGRSWFKATASVTFSLALAGSGYIRCTKTISGTTTELQIGGTNGYDLTEAEYVEAGYVFTDAITLAAGDSIDIYYVQNQQDWGGLVAKVVEGSTKTQALGAAAPVLGCGLFDTGSQPAKQTWTSVEGLQVVVEDRQAPQAVIRVPLVNPVRHDGFGWEWKKDSDSDPGHLACWNGGTQQFTLRRGRLVRIHLGYDGEQEKVFTGIVQDIPAPRDGFAQVACIGFEYRLIESRNKLEPDPISYMTFGLRKLTAVSEPVYGIGAYDAWTIENAVADMVYRAGIDASRMRQTLQVRKSNGTLVDVTFGSETFKKFRARSVLGTALKLERPVHYGNVGVYFTESKPVDDPYLFTPEARDDSWARVLEISDRYGYDIRFDALGDLVLSSRANPSYAYDIVSGDSAQASTRKTHPSAYKGTYQEWTNTPTVTKTVTGARIDASLPRGPTLGAWATITVRRVSDNAVVATHTNVSVTAASDTFYYDFRNSSNGNNATIFTVYSGDFDTYSVEFVASGAGTRRLDTLFVYHTDPTLARYALSTEDNAIDVTPQDAGDEMRNMVIVVGARKTAATDSEKFDSSNPNNADAEFIVEAAVDAASISDPTAPNYVGMRRESTIIDQKIADQDFAAYLARTFVYRYRTPKPPAQIPHTLIAELALRMPLTANEAMFKSVTPQSTLWVTGYTHEVGPNGVYTTDIRTSAWPEFPSYEPREDIDIDTDFNGVPIANVEVKYTSCSGHTKINLGSSGIVRESTDAADRVEVPGVALSSGVLDMGTSAWPPIPGTVMLRPSASSTNWTLVTEEYPNAVAVPPGIAEPNGIGVGYALAHNNGISPGLDQLIVLSGQAKTISTVKLVIWSHDGDGQPPTNGAWNRGRELTLTDPQWDYNEVEGVLHVHTGQLSNIRSFDKATVKVTYEKFASRFGQRWRGNNPYHHWMNVDYRDANRKIYLPWKQADGTANYGVPTGVTAFDVAYRKWGNVDGGGAYSAAYATGSPFYDVTTSELGHLVNLKFDALVSGLYRISVRSAYDHTVVAYLTEAGADPNEPEAHWQFLTAGAGRAFSWDGVDQLGIWNRKQSADYAATAQGWFEDEAATPIGAGWYVWNRELVGGGYGPIATISDERNATDGTPIYGQGTYAAWYFQVECKNDTLAAASEADRTKVYPRVTKTLEPNLGDRPPTYSTVSSAAIVYTHMPEPAQLELEIADWIEAYSFDPNDSSHLNDTHWEAPWYNRDLALNQTFEGLINNQKPVRVRFRLAPRGGTLWTNNGGEMQVKLTRHVHLKAVVNDSFVVGSGGSWPGTGTEQRTVYNRRLHNDEHTITFVDQGWRKAKTLKNSSTPNGVTEWVFRPLDFKKNFRGVENESIQYMDYLQLEEVPKWEQQRTAAGEHSRMLISFMAYLFYLSAYCIDRTGRRTWGVNRSFVDRYKIPANTYGDWWDPASTATPRAAATKDTFKAELPYDPVHQQRRTVVVRQWDQEAGWHTAQTTEWNFAADSIGDKLLRHKWKDHEPASANLNGAAWPALEIDHHSAWHRAGGRTELPAAFSSMTRQLGQAQSGNTTTLGDWTWEADPVWIPSVTRDFHPYYLIPPMPDPIDEQTAPLPGSNIYAVVSPITTLSNENTGRDPAVAQVWSSWARDMTRTYDSGPGGKVRFRSGNTGIGATDPTKGTGAGGVEADSVDYVRQDETVHFEDLRGLYSRGPRPAEAVRKIAPAPPYYINTLRYDQVAVNQARSASSDRRFPKYQVRVSEWFRLAFRTEYLWESSTFFPVDDIGRERFDQMNVWKSRFMGDGIGRTLVSATGSQQVAYDGGAWTGWKDDSATSFYQANVFEPGIPAMLFDICGMQGPTADIYMHLVLVNERRKTPV